MRKARAVILIITCVVFLFFSSHCLAAAANNGFSASKRIESRYFSIFIEDGVDLQGLALKISVPPSIKGIIMDPTASSCGYDLQDQLDLLFLAVSEIMDIRLKDFKVNLKICRDVERLSGIADRLFGQDIQTGGFYVVALDTLYIDAEGINIHILGHELSHAIQTHYFVVPAPARIQEVLAGYVEYELRKYSGSLPK